MARVEAHAPRTQNRNLRRPAVAALAAVAFLAAVPASPQPEPARHRRITGVKQQTAPIERDSAIDLGVYSISNAEKIPQFEATQSLRQAIMGRFTGSEPASNVRPYGERYYVVGVQTPARQDAKEQITEAGGEVIDTVPNGFIVKMDGGTAEEVEGPAAAAVDFVDLYEPEYKISDTLREEVEKVQRGEPLQIQPRYEPLEEAPAAGPAGAGGPAAILGDLAETPPMLEVTVYLFPNADQAPVAQVIQDQGGTVLGAGEQGTVNKIRARIPPGAVDSLAGLNEVRSILPYAPASLRNDAAAEIIRARPTEAAASNLTGANQIIGHADSGIDIGQLDGSPHADFQGRILKGIAIGRTADWSDPDGHGTHTAGSLVGTGAESAHRFRGIAPEAILVHQSLQGAEGDLRIPDPLGALFQQAYDLGARIHSDSWGIPVRRFPSAAGEYRDGEDVDAWTWNEGNPRDMLVVIAAGNDGAVGDGSVGSPATAKNCLAVGASESLRPAVAADADNADDLASFSSLGPTDSGRIRPDVVAPGTWIVSARTHGEHVLWEDGAESADGWTAAAAFSLSSEVVLSGSRSWRYQRPAGATFSDFLTTPTLALPGGPVSIEFWMRGTVERDVMAIAIRTGAGQWLALHRFEEIDLPGWRSVSIPLPDSFRSAPNVQLAVAMIRSQNGPAPVDVALDQFRVTSFASAGPLSLGNLAAPNDALDREYTVMNGTSMAAPVVAGAAALVRESLTAEGIAPSAELLKAMLINGTTPLGNGWPNNRFGWGRIDLARTLETPHIFDFETRLLEGESIEYPARLLSGGGQLRATLVWADPPADRLRHNLDMVLIDPSGLAHFPSGASAAAPEDDNNVEGISVLGAAAGVWTVRVSATDVDEGPQPFAVVISGDLAP